MGHTEVTPLARGHAVLTDSEAREKGRQTRTHFQLFGAFGGFQSYDHMADGLAVAPHGVLGLTRGQLCDFALVNLLGLLYPQPWKRRQVSSGERQNSPSQIHSFSLTPERPFKPQNFHVTKTHKSAFLTMSSQG